MNFRAGLTKGMEPPVHNLRANNRMPMTAAPIPNRIAICLLEPAPNWNAGAAGIEASGCGTSRPTCARICPQSTPGTSLNVTR